MKITNPEKYEWQDQASCLGLDTNIFFPEGGGSTLPLTARRMCAACPVRVECLEAALEMEGATCRSERHGFFGGLSPNKRYAEYLRRTADKRAAMREGRASVG